MAGHLQVIANPLLLHKTAAGSLEVKQLTDKLPCKLPLEAICKRAGQASLAKEERP